MCKYFVEMIGVKIGVIGLGYVGLPLARLFATKYAVVGFDINQDRVMDLIAGEDRTLEVDSNTLKSVLKKQNSDANGLYCSSNICLLYTSPSPRDA